MVGQAGTPVRNDVSAAEVEAKIARINQLVAQFKSEMEDVKSYKQNIIHTVLERTKHHQIQQLLNDINQQNP